MIPFTSPSTYLEQYIRNEEYTERKVILCALQTQFLTQTKHLCIPDIDSVKEGKEIHHRQHRQNPKIHFANDSSSLGLAYRTIMTGAKCR